MDEITVSSTALTLRGDRPLTSAMLSVVWEISGLLDERRIPPKVDTAIWLETSSRRLRGGPGGRTDNIWLRECLHRLTGLRLSGTYRDVDWEAVLIAQWELYEHGSMVRVLVPQAAVHALRAPETFAKLEVMAAHRLAPHAKQLYAILADKKRLGRSWWAFGVDELRALLGVEGRKSYRVWGQFRKRVLNPAINNINAYGAVTVRMTAQKTGRSVTAVRFDWQWRDPHEAADIVGRAPKQSQSRVKTDIAPPDAAAEAREWWARTDRKTRKYTLLKLGIANPGSEDLQDESPYVLEAWQLIRDLKAPPDEHT